MSPIHLEVCKKWFPDKNCQWKKNILVRSVTLSNTRKSLFLHTVNYMDSKKLSTFNSSSANKKWFLDKYFSSVQCYIIGYNGVRIVVPTIIFLQSCSFFS
jgi:hypothetical protein